MSLHATPSVAQILACHQWLDQVVRHHQSLLTEPLDANPLPDDDADLIWAWWTATRPQRSGQQAAHRISGMVAPALTIAGVLTGGSVTSVALTYTGSHPVNLFVLLGLTVGFPLLGLLLTWLMRGTHWIRPSTHQTLVGVTALWLRRINAETADYMEMHLWRYGELLYWSAQRTLQWFSLGFLFASLVTLLLLVTFTDIAFGWSSTLNIAPTTVHAGTEWLSLAWQSWLPSAHPSLELVTDSRFFRMNADNDPERLALWWPFVAMCIVVWGILPRLAMWSWCCRNVRLNTRLALVNHPDVNVLVEQARRRSVTYRSTLPPTSEETTRDTVAFAPDTAISQHTISWNDATITDWQARSGDDEQTRATLLSSIPPNVPSLSVTVKGWEPPLLEFNDFLQKLREHIGADVTIRIDAQPLPTGELGAAQINAWRTTLARLNDPKIYLRPHT